MDKYDRIIVRSKLTGYVDIVKEVYCMDIPGLSMALSQTELMTQVSTAMLAKSMDTVETMTEGMVKMMEASVTPNLGQNIDISI